MANRSFSVTSWTATAVADTTNMVNAQFMALQGGTASQRLIIHEVYLGGQSSSSAPTFLILGRDSQVGASASLTAAANDTALDPDTAALAAAPLSFDTTSGAKPQRSSSLHLHNMSFNPFGGIVRLNFPPGQEPIVRGSAVNVGEISLSAITTGGGLIGSHIIYEPL